MIPKLTRTALNAIEDSTKLQSTTDKFSDWSFRWGMDFNTKKCKRLHIGKHQYKENYSMKNSKGERYQIQNVIEEEDSRADPDIFLRGVSPKTDLSYYMIL